MIEKVKLSDDKYLRFPVISFVVEETLKTKEAKTDARYALLAEIAAASAVAAAGADVIVMHSPEAQEVMEKIWN
jgi:CO dehydrogenase/acetyl-CoA synthase gamma subunit (corrinoid Fe-S protein)